LDNGYNWTVIETGIWMSDIYFASADTGFALSTDYGSILKTVDGGYTWSAIHPGFGFALYNIQFTDQLHGYITGYSGSLLITDDGGQSWVQKNINATKPLRGYYFVNNIVGYAASNDSTLFKTTDGGNNWLEIPLETWYAVRSISFLNADTGFVLKGEGEIFFTTDGGNTWSRQFANTETGIQIKITDKNTAYIIGAGSLLKHSISLTGVKDTQPNQEIEIDVYPNPANKNCLIKYNLPKQTFIEISLYSSKGIRNNTLFVGHKQAGEYEIPITLNNMASGVYLIKIQTDYGIFNKKLVIK
jgi:hypothetical protein